MGVCLENEAEGRRQKDFHYASCEMKAYSACLENRGQGSGNKIFITRVVSYCSWCLAGK